MNTRILELIKNPDIIQITDLDLLNSEVKSHPYLQSIRALQLIGNHQFNSDNCQKELSTTAAYTTDKKILYQLVNKNKLEANIVENKIINEVQEEIILDKKIEEKIEEKVEETVIIAKEEIKPEVKEIAKPVYVEGVLNRILFEGEEDFLERETENIDIESTLESGKLVTRKAEKVDLAEEKIEEIEEISEIKTEEPIIEVPESETASTETIINEDQIEEEKEIIENPSEISFHGSEDFLPQVQIKTNIISSQKYEAPKPQLNKQEEEMQRLIAEVEAKVKASKKTIIKEVEPIENADINFSNTQEFKIEPTKIEEKITEKTQPEIGAEEVETSTPQNPSWKPMSFSAPTPDAMISTESLNKKVEATINTNKEEISETPIDVTKTEERPVFNVSFFTPNVSSIESKKPELEAEILEEKTNFTEKSFESNVPVFINTWQNWLKIERKEPIIDEKETISKEELKNIVIEKFIEKEPKISKLKEESDFVVKEKASDISHLMTETLANLYVEQKLYAKATKAYEILIEKHPDKESIFNDKIQEIKDLRKNP